MSVISCSKDDDNLDDDNNNNNNNNGGDIDDPFDTNSKDTIFVNAVVIEFSEDIVTVKNPYENQGVEVSVDGGDVVVNSTVTSTEVNYVLSGKHSDAMFKVYSDYKFGIGLNGVSLINSDGPAINIQSGKRASVYLVGETNNRLIDNNIYTSNSEDMKGTFFSEGQLIFKGSGNLILKGYNRHAICSDDYIQIDGGNITIRSAYKDGIHSNEYFEMNGGAVNITATSNGIECEKGYIELNKGNIVIKSDEDAIIASYKGSDSAITPYVKIGNPNINITTTGQKSMGVKSTINSIRITGGVIDITTSGLAAKAFKSGGDMAISNSDITMTILSDAFFDTADGDVSSPAGVKCDGNMTINSGKIVINSSGVAGRGINVDGNLIINNGTIDIKTSGGVFEYNSDNSAAQAIACKGDLVINNGLITIKTSGEEAEGLKCKNAITIKKGILGIETYDNSINASGNLTISGGDIYCNSVVGDGINTKGTFTLTGGTVVSLGGSSSGAGVGCASNTFKITGGTLIGAGTQTSTPSSSSMQYSVIYNTAASAEQVLHIEDNNENSIVIFEIPKDYSSMSLLVTSPKFKANTDHTVYSGGSVSGGSSFYGLYSGAVYTGGENVASFTTTGKVTVIGD
ncbi:carbohydrate-binding domain-containing protein [Dysgonomonas sp. 216]|nr:carbohydrate-binding domain-containing protein [Dysgonomonas sp. 216]